MTKIVLPDTAESVLLWKKSNKKKLLDKKWPLSVEEHNEEYINKLGWFSTGSIDVLYSFLGIYAIGIWVYNKDIYPDRFELKSNKLMILHDWITIRDGNKESNKPKPNRMSMFCFWQVLGSVDYLYYIQNSKLTYSLEIEELNEDIQNFISVYFDVGNISPIWPGGNTLKGNQNNGFMDIPELFYSRYIEWYELLKSKYNNIGFETIEEKIGGDNYSSISNFLSFVNCKEKYREYIRYATEVINYRTEKIRRFINENI